MTGKYRVPPASAYSGPDAGSDRWEDYKLVREGKPPVHARREVTEAVDPALIREALAGMGVRVAGPVPDVDVTPADLVRLRIDDPAAYAELRRGFANAIFAGHDARRVEGGGRSPFNRSVGA